MEPHPIEELMKTAMESIKEMVDVNTIVGDAVQTVDGTVIIPVSRVSFGFAAGGGEYAKGDNKNQDSKFPFAGGSGSVDQSGCVYGCGTQQYNQNDTCFFQ
jgi:sporulation protein YtfJ